MLKDILCLSEKLVKIESVSSTKKNLKEVIKTVEAELQDFTIERFEKEGFPSILVYPYKNRPRKFKIILNGHLDVVSGEKGQFVQRRKGNFIYGRGVYDMKTAAACMVILFNKLARRLAYPIALQLVTDEEIGGFRGTKYQIEKGVRADFVLGGEPTNLNISYASKGVIQIKLIAKGRSTHSAYLWKGENAVLKLHSFIDEVLRIFPIPSGRRWVTTVNLAKIEVFNHELNKVPEKAEGYLDIRYVKKEKGKFLKTLKRLANKYGIKYEFIHDEPAVSVKKHNPFLRKLSEKVKKVTGLVRFIKSFGSSDIRHFARVGIPGVSFGLKGEGHHSLKERIELESIEKYYLSLEEFLASI